VEARVSREDLARVAVIGTSCAGKTWTASRLGEILGSKHLELDAMYWGPEWAECPAEEFRRKVSAELDCDRWVVDGNYRVVRDLVWDRATAVVWLNYAFPLVFGRAVRRTARRVATGERIFSGNRETFRAGFLSRDAIPWWVVRTFRRRKREYAALLADRTGPGFAVIELRHPRDADEFLRSLTSVS
jgi:adenylate kinase family enzyme